MRWKGFQDILRIYDRRGDEEVDQEVFSDHPFLKYWDAAD